MLAGLVVLWYVAVVPMNIAQSISLAKKDGVEVSAPETIGEMAKASKIGLTLRNPDVWRYSYSHKRPRLPAPHQVGEELNKTVLQKNVTSKRSLVYHGLITLRSTLYGFVLGVSLGLAMAVAVVYTRVAEMSLMPWAVISQTIPIVALAPMIIVVSGQMGIASKDVPKAIISAYLCFFPVLVGMVKGLRAPDAMQLDLLRTYGTSGAQVFWKLRLPASMPYLFTSLKIGIAAALVGTIVGELPAGAIQGLGARILIGDQFGNPIMVWAALIAAAVLAGVLVTVVSLLQGVTLRRMGFAR
ncbi:Pyrimidine ABC transporter, transmembrane component 2 [Candidatus Rhodobacter oscarellae]|uniref:Pyrimidine ABC transporter, transmembrane component 2 n=1 Tax=Candidatus Rhodobacter oscarellae TaxID=1675527 RepID=A0A0J9GY12_9RHOB|nr:Pyrimidine ABC transporter, transmembrane component 2 [Candidatus Rhodobacter lobularis]